MKIRSVADLNASGKEKCAQADVYPTIFQPVDTAIRFVMTPR